MSGLKLPEREQAVVVAVDVTHEVVDLGGRGLVCTALFTPMEVSVPRYSASMFGSDSCPAREKYCSTLRSALGRQRCTFGQVVERIASFVNLFKCTYIHTRREI